MSLSPNEAEGQIISSRGTLDAACQQRDIKDWLELSAPAQYAPCMCLKLHGKEVEIPFRSVVCAGWAIPAISGYMVP